MSWCGVGVVLIYFNVGDKDMTVSAQENPKGVDTPHFQKTQNEQKVGSTGVVNKAYNSAHYGSNNDAGK